MSKLQVLLLSLSLTAASFAASSPIDPEGTKPGTEPGQVPRRLSARPEPHQAYAGFDKNAYPGDGLLPGLRKSFAFTGYWLNNPPGMTTNQWLGKRSFVRARGFGFLLLFNGRLDADLKAAAAEGHDAASLGRSDAAAAIAAAHTEGFPSRAVIFLDQEEGGHLLPEQSAYLFAWIDAVRHPSTPAPARSTSRAAGLTYNPGVYCSGIAANANDAGTTAGDILQHYKGRSTPAIWVANDQCPPAPGCLLEKQPPHPAISGTPSAAVWQYAQSPRREQFTAGCVLGRYAPDSACYAPGLAHSANTAIDLDSASSPDPSHGR